MRVLVFSEEGVGNGILRTPLIAALSVFADVDVMASKRSEQVMRLCLQADNVYVEGDELQGHYDIAVDPQFTSGVLARTYAAHYDKLYRAKKDFGNKHEVMHSLPFIEDIFPEYEWEEFTPENYPLEIGPFSASPREGVAIHTGCLDTHAWRNRFWDIENWCALIDEIHAYSGLPVTLLGHPSEWHRNGAILRGLEHSADYLADDLRGTAAFLRKSRLLVCLDSGIMHLGASQDTPIVALFGPTCVTKSHPWMPVSRYKIIQKELDCKGCHIYHRDRFDSCEDNVCMKDITVDDVMGEIKELEW